MALISEHTDKVVLGFDSEVKWRLRSSSSFDTLDLPSPITSARGKSTVSSVYTYHNSNNIVKNICFSQDGKYFAVMTSCKQLCIYGADSFMLLHQHQLPRAASKIRFSADSKYILVADKTGDALIYCTNKPEENGIKILGHLSLLLDILMTRDNKYIITCDRDEKIKVSHYPGTYNIQSYCLGHKEFVTSIEFLPHNENCLISASGDGTVKVWLFMDGKEIHSIDVSNQVQDPDTLANFAALMKQEDIDADCLPISYMSCCKADEQSSLLATALYLFKGILIYKLSGSELDFRHNILYTLNLESYPESFNLNKDYLSLCFTSLNIISYQIWDLSTPGNGIIRSCETLSRQHNVKINSDKMILDESKGADILVLYKKKFDNLQEYHERKKQRLEGRSK